MARCDRCAFGGAREPLRVLEREMSEQRPLGPWKQEGQDEEPEKGAKRHRDTMGHSLGSPQAPEAQAVLWCGAVYFWAARMERDWLIFTMAIMRRPPVSRKVGQNREKSRVCGP